VNEFINLGSPISVQSGMEVSSSIKKKETVVSLQNPTTGIQIDTKGTNAVQAILWGLRLWAIEQFRIVDEILLPDKGYTLFPINDSKSSEPASIARLLLNLITVSEEWATFRVPDFILLACDKYKLPVETVKNGLLWLYKQYPDLIAAIPSSQQFIITRAHSAQTKVLLNSYIQLSTGEYISHFQIHKTISRLKGG